MVLFGKHAFIFDGASGRKCNVQPFDSSLGAKRGIPIRDGAIAYDCPHTHKTYILIGRNVLSVPSLEHNSIPPFILREAGLIVNDSPKIHKEDPTMDDHAIIIPQENDLHIPLQFNGIFSFLYTRCSTAEEIQHCENIILITPDSESWDPYSTHYAENEAAMLDWEGNMMDEKYRVKRQKLDEDLYGVSNITADKYEEIVDATISSAFASMKLNVPTAYESPCVGNKSDAGDKDDVACESSAQSDTEFFAQSLRYGAEVSHASMSLGATGISNAGDDLFEFDELITFQIDIENDPVLASVIAEKPSKLNADFLSKIWHIKNDEVAKDLDQTTQYCRHGADNALSRQFSTNDCMLRYRRINSMFSQIHSSRRQRVNRPVVILVHRSL